MVWPVLLLHQQPRQQLRFPQRSPGFSKVAVRQFLLQLLERITLRRHQALQSLKVILAGRWQML
jgi:hypothetical protein